MREFEAILIAGATASGKSRLALDLAGEHGGVIVNADSMQIYDGLPILTAQPSRQDFRQVPHRLYGYVDPAETYSTGKWLRDARTVTENIRREGRRPVFVGGTGLYFRALLGGLDEMPAIPEAVRDRWRRRLAEEGAAALHACLVNRDSEAARRIGPGDGQRIARALELWEVTGRPLSELQQARATPLVDAEKAWKIVLAPPRPVLRARIAERFGQMMESGALDEVSAFRQRREIGEGARRAIGVAELGAVLDGTMGRAEAIQRAITRTRQYAKRQETWFRNQLGDDWQRFQV